MTSRQNATFAAIRRVIQSDLDDDVLPDKQWKFYVPKLGPMSVKQEGKVGPASILLSTTKGMTEGLNGALFALIFRDCPLATFASSL